MAALTPEKQVKYEVKLRTHLYVIYNGPCYKFEGYPFKWDPEKFDVSITAVVENFEQEHQHKLVREFNRMLSKYDSYSNFNGRMIASSLDRVEGGIQFAALKGDIFLDEHVKSKGLANHWAKFETYNDFIQHCQIRFTNNYHFGNTDARVVTFTACHAVPIYTMMWLLHQLDNTTSGVRNILGDVIISNTNGLPPVDDHLHFGMGLIAWN
jgi:hypothetical protein